MPYILSVHSGKTIAFTGFAFAKTTKAYQKHPKLKNLYSYEQKSH